MTQQTLSIESEQSQQWVIYVAKLLSNDISEAAIVKDLEKNGFDATQATEFVRQVNIKLLADQTRATKKVNISKLGAVILILAGIGVEVLSIWSIASAIEKGGILWWGGIILGFGLMGAGWKGLQKSPYPEE